MQNQGVEQLLIDAVSKQQLTSIQVILYDLGAIVVSGGLAWRAAGGELGLIQKGFSQRYEYQYLGSAGPWLARHNASCLRFLDSIDSCFRSIEVT